MQGVLTERVSPRVRSSQADACSDSLSQPQRDTFIRFRIPVARPRCTNMHKRLLIQAADASSPTPALPDRTRRAAWPRARHCPPTVSRRLTSTYRVVVTPTVIFVL